MTTKNASELLRPDSFINLVEDQLSQDDSIHCDQAAEISTSTSSNVQHAVESEPQSLLTCAQQETTSIGLQLPSTTKLTFSSDAATFDVIAKVKKDCDKDRNMQRHQNLVGILGEFSSKLEQLLPFVQNTNGTLTLVIGTGNAEDSKRLEASGECVSQVPEDEELGTGNQNVMTPDTPVVVSEVKKSGVKLKMPNEPEAETEIVKILGEIDMRDQELQADSYRDQHQATQTPTTATPNNGFVDLAGCQLLPVTTDVVAELIDTSLQGLRKLWDLGSGTFGKVNLVQCQKTGRLFANKQLKWCEDGSEEFKIMEDLCHKNIARVLGYCFDDNTSHIFLEWFPVALKDLVECCHHLEETLVTAYMHHLLEGLAYLHDSKMIVHRDIKPDNLFIDSQGTLKIGDFGNACHLQDCKEDPHPLGTLLYNAPEYMRGEPYSTACDVWSSGVVLVYMATGQTIWPHWEKVEMNQMILIFLIGNIEKTPMLPELKSELLYNLMANCLRVEKTTRPSAMELLSSDVCMSLPSANVGSALAVDGESAVTDVSDAFGS